MHDALILEITSLHHGRAHASVEVVPSYFSYSGITVVSLPAFSFQFSVWFILIKTWLHADYTRWAERDNKHIILDEYFDFVFLSVSLSEILRPLLVDLDLLLSCHWMCGLQLL